MVIYKGYIIAYLLITTKPLLKEVCIEKIKMCQFMLFCISKLLSVWKEICCGKKINEKVTVG